MCDPISFAIVGMGMLGKSHAEVILNHPSSQLVAVCDLDRHQIDMFCRTNSSVHPYTDYRTMFTTEKIDVVIVATPDAYHKDPILQALESGIKTIICEKPLSTNLKDAEEIAKAAKEANASIYLCFMLRMSPFNRAIRALVKSQVLGSFLHGEFVNDDSYFVPTEYWGDRSKEWAMKSSPIHFLFSHTVDCLRYIFNPREVEKLYSLGKQEGTGSECDYCEALLVWDDGSVIRIKTEWMRKIRTLVETYSVFTFEKAGIIHRSTDAAGPSFLRIDFNDKNVLDEAEAVLQSEGFTARTEIAPKTFAKYSLVLLPEENRAPKSFPSSTYILDYLLGDHTHEESIVDLDGGVEQVRIIEAILQSMRLDKPVVVGHCLDD